MILTILYTKYDQPDNNIKIRTIKAKMKIILSNHKML